MTQPTRLRRVGRGDIGHRAFELRIRQEALQHGLSLEELPDLLELLAARQRERLERSDQRLRRRETA